jgi:hypothetical protein
MSKNGRAALTTTRIVLITSKIVLAIASVDYRARIRCPHSETQTLVQHGLKTAQALHFQSID